MPIYLYKGPDGEVKEVFQSMNEEHVYGEDGIQWVRIFCIPQASFDVKIDPFSSTDFREKTGKKRGTVGDLWNTSKELSLKRESIAGQDFIKEKHLDNYEKKRKRKHPERREKALNEAIRKSKMFEKD